MDSGNIGGLFLASTKAVTTLSTVFAVGLFAGYYPRPHGILTPATVKTLSTLIMALLSPCLILSVYSTQLSSGLLSNIAACAAWCLIHTAVNFCLGLLTLTGAGPPPHHAGAYRAALIFGNSASLPFLLLAVLVQRPSLRGDADAFNRGVVYCFGYLIPWWVSMYSVGFELLRPRASAAGAPEGAPAPPPAVATDALSVLKRTVQQPPVVATAVGCVLGLTPLGALFWGASPPLEGVGSVVTLLGQGSIPCANLVLAGSLFSAAAELARDTRAWLGEAPLAETASGAAACASSAALFARAARACAAASASGRLPLPEEGVAPAAAPGEAAFFSARATLWVVCTRLLVSPALCFLLFFAAQRAGVLLSTDPVLTLVVLVQAAMPSAQTLLVVSNNVGNEAIGKAFSLLYVVMYPLCTLALIPWLTLAMSLAGI